MLRVCTSSTESSLLSLDSYKAAAKVATTSDDSVMQSSLDRATSLVESYVGYPLRRQVYYETVPAFGSNELLLSRVPVRSIESIYYGSDLVDPTSYDIGSESGGLVYRELGWPWTAGVEYDLGPHPVPKSELRSFAVTYEAGYCMNGSTQDGWLTTGEPVPSDLEVAIMMTAAFVYGSQARDPSVTMKRIGDLQITYQGGPNFSMSTPSMGIPDTVKGMLSHYRRF